MKRIKGFTLIEMLTVLALIGLLTSLAWPSFQGFQQRAQRTLAKVALLKAAHWMERTASSQGRYPSVMPEGVWQSPDMRYRLELQNLDAAFVLMAVPTGGQSADACATLTLNQAGERGVQGATLPAGVCWGH